MAGDSSTSSPSRVHFKTYDSDGNHDDSLLSATTASSAVGENGGPSWVVQKYGGTSLGKFATQIVQNIIR